MSIDIRIPDSGWDKPEWRDDGSDPYMLGALFGPVPAWVYDLVKVAAKFRSAIYLHPEQYYALRRTDWANPAPGLMIVDMLFGIEIIVDPEVPTDVAQLRPATLPTAADLPALKFPRPPR
jgi:hypothetical protein